MPGMAASVAPRRWIALAGVGLAVGARSLTPPAAIAWRRTGTPVAVRGVLTALAAGEYVGDKLPNAPARSSPAGLASRLSAGVAVGWVLAGPQGAATVGAVATAAGAGLSLLRGRIVATTGRDDRLVALGEDLLAIALTAVAVDPALAA